MEVNQIYALVNSIAKQTIGETAIEATDTSTLVALGDTILSDTNTTEGFMNTLIERIGRTIISYRKYNSQLAPIIKSDMEWGAIVQKIKVEMPEVVEDATYSLEDGKSVDMYVVRRPKAKQKFFAIRTPYSCFISIQQKQLKAAFLNATTMGSFISAVFGEIKNKLELSIENNSRLCMANFMALTDTAQQINLVTNYNAIKGTNVTAESALYDEGFLRYAIGQMNMYSKKMRTMSQLFNKEKYTRFTPDCDQIFAIINEFQTAMETQVQYAAFHDDYVKKGANIEVPYWQATQNPYDIKLSVRDGVDDTGIKKKAVEIKNIVGFLFDKEALGSYRQEEEVLTTPINARGRYANTFWHEEQMWFNDLSENGIIFTLN